ncbi:unnamed protein product [Effrenium voratum]|uniref:Uncharacterized protein n=1 Tax=Effrenium voratum TaxID=2562239 RepID=A0AA36I033_9DINO|nr:unnamed protein product [Effrenium voratum]
MALRAVLTLALPAALAGPLYPACYTACMATCLSGVAAAVVVPPAGLAGAAGCASVCATLCAPSCFADDTTLQLAELPRGSSAVKIGEVQTGKRVWTLQNGQPMPALVVENRSFGFVELAVVSEGMEVNITITEDHNMPRLRRPHPSASFSEEDLEVVLAKELMLGDMMAIHTPGGVSLGVLAGLRLVQKGVKHVLSTATGSVLANGVLSSTICDGHEKVYNRSSWSMTLQQWWAMHAERFAL